MGTETQGKIIIRRGEARDAQAIYRIGTLCFTDAWREETVAHDLAQPLSRYWVAEVNHQVAAFACFWFVVDELQLVNIGVEPAMRRMGIAERLLRSGMEEAKKCGLAHMSLEVRIGNLPAQHLYKKYGLEIASLRKGAYEHPAEDGYIMTRTL